MSQSKNEAPLPTSQGGGDAASRRRFVVHGLILATLAISVFAIYARVVSFDFISFDDDLYVAKNPRIQAGLTPGNIRWALTSQVAANWLPVTLLSHMLDVELFGLNSGMHHLVNVAFHAAAAILLFVFLRRSTGSTGPSAFAAFLFALHPLHVESVAWISERKDVLSAFFLFLALYAWVRYIERQGVFRYLLVVASFSVGLMTKPMLVSFPLVLLLLDVWPLRRTQWSGLFRKKSVLWKLILEKTPFVVISAFASLIAFLVQWHTGSVKGGAITIRVSKAILSYVTYIWQSVWPIDLAAYYPYPSSMPTVQVFASFAILVAVSAFVIRFGQARPYLVTGWFWYLVTLLPAIGLIQVGEQSHADRYMYIPMVGLSMMLAWGAWDITRERPGLKPAIAAAALLVIGVCAILTWRQVAVWRNSETLNRHAIAVTRSNWLAESNLGVYLAGLSDRRFEAVEHFEASLRINPSNAQANNNMGVWYLRNNLCVAAIPYFEAAIRQKRNSSIAEDNLGWCLASGERFSEAVPHFEAALRAQPDSPGPHLHLAQCLSKIPGRKADAIAQYQEFLRIRPDDETALRDLQALLTQPASQPRSER